MSDRWRYFANLATLANAVVGIGAVLYTIAGNRLWGMLLIVCGLAFDGMDGLFSRRSRANASAFGRGIDSVADAITFGVAPATLIAVHTANAARWLPYATTLLLVAGLYLLLALARLAYFALRAYDRPNFIGVPTPQSALAIVVIVLLFDVPAFAGVQPVALLLLATIAAVLMVVPIPYPKIRGGAPLRLPMAVTGAALAVALIPVQFQLARGSALYPVAFAATAISAVGLLVYYVGGPWTVPTTVRPRKGTV